MRHSQTRKYSHSITIRQHIRKYNFRNCKNIDTCFTKVHVGGGIAEAHGIHIWENRDGTSFAIFAGKLKRVPYIILIFDTKTKIIELESFSTDRIVPGHIQGESIADILIQIVYEICYRKKTKQLVLQDNSQKMCSANTKVFRLADAYFLCHGQTWYETKFKGLQCDKSIDVYRSKVMENTWDSVMATIEAEYPIEYDTIKTYMNMLELPLFKTSEKGSATQMFLYLKDNQLCEPFTIWMDFFLIGSNVPSMYATTWHLDF